MSIGCEVWIDKHKFHMCSFVVVKDENMYVGVANHFDATGHMEYSLMDEEYNEFIFIFKRIERGNGV